MTLGLSSPKAPVRVRLKKGIIEDIFNNSVRTPVRIGLKSSFFEDIFKTAKTGLKKGPFFNPVSAVLKKGIEEIQPSYGS